MTVRNFQFIADTLYQRLVTLDENTEKAWNMMEDQRPRQAQEYTRIGFQNSGTLFIRDALEEVRDIYTPEQIMVYRPRIQAEELLQNLAVFDEQCERDWQREKEGSQERKTIAQKFNMGAWNLVLGALDEARPRPIDGPADGYDPAETVSDGYDDYDDDSPRM